MNILNISGLREQPGDIFRFNPDRELIPFDRLPESEKATLDDTPDIFGVVRGREGSGMARVVGCDAALLIYALTEPQVLPAYVTRSSRANVLKEELSKLLLDGVLEVQDGDRFISGSALLPRLSSEVEPRTEQTAPSYVARVTKRAVGDAAGKVGELSPAALSDWLYMYHRLPLTARQFRLWGDTETVLHRLGCSPELDLGKQLARQWRMGRRTYETDWLQWSRRDVEAPRSSEAVFKLYISPMPDALPETFARLVEVLPDTRAFYFKTAADAASVLRPDKLMVYFADFESLYTAAQLLTELLHGLPAHGVPLTCEIGLDGLLSWGFDPPRETSGPGTSREGWRVWLATRIAMALSVAAEQPDPDRPLWQCALDRLRIEGVDVDTWKPSLSQWQKPLEEIYR